MITQKEKPDLILIDWLMPKMNGLETIRVLRNMPSCADIPIVVSSAYVGNEEEMADVLDVADDFLKKPIDLTGLQECLTRLLKLQWES